MEKSTVVKQIAPIAVLALLGVAPVLLDAVGGVLSLG